MRRLTVRRLSWALRRCGWIRWSRLSTMTNRLGVGDLPFLVMVELIWA
jgi:hypothetical protein